MCGGESSAAVRTASACLGVRDLEGRPGRPAGTEHSSTTLRFTLSRAMARLIARFRHDRIASTNGC
jgi:hypothetical protein